VKIVDRLFLHKFVCSSQVSCLGAGISYTLTYLFTGCVGFVEL